MKDKSVAFPRMTEPSQKHQTGISAVPLPWTNSPGVCLWLQSSEAHALEDLPMLLSC